MLTKRTGSGDENGMFSKHVICNRRFSAREFRQCVLVPGSVVNEKMSTTLQKHSSPSLASVISVVSIFLLLRVEFQLIEHKERINALEEVTKTQQTASGHIFTGSNRDSPGKLPLC